MVVAAETLLDLADEIAAAETLLELASGIEAEAAAAVIDGARHQEVDALYI